MEVHHHSHTARKKWTHYFWEFLMLFLAVFCGFLAENQREHLVEKHRAKEYAKSLLSDLKLDTTELRLGTHQTAFIISAIDSLQSITSKNSNKETVPGTFYYYSRFTSNFYRIDWSRSTITQLVQSGNLRYIKNKELVNKINSYYAWQALISNQNETDRQHRDRVMEFRNRILQNKYYSVFATLKIFIEEFGHQPSPEIDSLMLQNLPLQEGAEKNLDEYLNHLNDRKWRLVLTNESYYPDVVKTATEIIGMLKKEYHLK